MSTETRQPDTPERPDRGPGYEQSDAHIKPLLQFGFWLAVLIVVTLFGVHWLFYYYARVQTLGPPASPLVKESQRILPPRPRLQPHPHQNLVTFCTQQEQQVDTYGWIDRKDGIVRIPISRAMALTLQKGLPTRPASETPTGPAAPHPGRAFTAGRADVGGPCAYLGLPSDGQSVNKGAAK